MITKTYSFTNQDRIDRIYYKFDVGNQKYMNHFLYLIIEEIVIEVRIGELLLDRKKICGDGLYVWDDMNDNLYTNNTLVIFNFSWISYLELYKGAYNVNISCTLKYDPKQCIIGDVVGCDKLKMTESIYKNGKYIVGDEVEIG